MNERISENPSSRSIQQILLSAWGHSSFRPMQEEIIHSVLSGKDTLALLPTGGGKSVCYQVPAIFQQGLCLVISPLIALMKDQVEQLRKKNITAFALYAGMTRKEVEQTLKVVSDSNCRFLYVSPERLETTLFKEYLASLDIKLIAVDEAHCISQWGYDFRPPYLRIAELRKALPKVPVIALTASATPKVQEDIIQKLSFGEHAVFRQSFERPNLSYSVFEADAKINKIIEILEKVKGSSLVYCKSRKRTQEISGLLKMHGITADYYHAGLSNETRSQKQASWIQNKIRTMVCTNAFGMGIDKPDVRVVIHADIPGCLENYYQEAGRAGRDGQKAYAVLLYNSKDVTELKAQPAERFPSLETIREIYQSIMNYLQLPLNSGAGNYYDFDLLEFRKKFGQETSLVWSVLKVLEQEDVLSYAEQAFVASTVQFITNKELLYDFELTHPVLEPLIKTLLRSYEGIFDYPARIHEKTIAYLLKTGLEIIKDQLTQLHSFGIIRYSPQKDNPQLFFPRNRVSATELYINQQQYKQRKEEFVQRLEAMIAYTANRKTCRSQAIALYFGDHAVKECGICDNCLSAGRRQLSREEFAQISESIIQILSVSALDSKNLLGQLKNVKPEKALEVIDFLQSEDKIQISRDGIIRVTKK